MASAAHPEIPHSETGEALMKPSKSGAKKVSCLRNLILVNQPFKLLKMVEKTQKTST
jgi:hypothetical protein